MAIKVTEFNKFFGDFDRKVKVFMIGYQVAAEVLEQVEPDNIDTGGSEMFAPCDTIEELQKMLDVSYDIKLDLEIPSFEHNGMNITNPYMEETGRYAVSNPINYYGISQEVLDKFNHLKPEQ